MSDRIEIIKELRALEKFCAFPASLTGEDRERFLKDYLADVQEFPLDAIRSACAEWRKSGSTKFPTSGLLIPIIRRFVGATSAERAQPWSPAGRDEFHSMSVRDKIRELSILAHEARTKAGPMFRNATPGGAMAKAKGKHLSADQMPDTWRRWSAEAERLEAEVKRLREIVRTPYAQAAE